MWQLHEAHGSIRRSLVLNEGARHFLLVTYAEERAHLGEAAIFLEIIWNGKRTTGYGHYCPLVSSADFCLWVFYSVLDYWMLALCLIDVTLTWMAHTSMDQPLHYDMALSFRLSYFPAARLSVMRSRNHSLSRLFPHRLCLHLHPVTLHPSLRAPQSHPNLWMLMNIPEWYISSDLLHLEEPTHIHALTPPGTRSWRTSVFSAWPRLRYDPWQVATVHQSIAAEYPQQDDVTYCVVIAQPDLPSPAHMVPLVVLHWREFTFFRAIVLPRFATTGHVLAALGLVPFCGIDQEHCPVYHNGSPWSQTSRQAIDHGDYIRVAPRLVPFPGLEEHLAQVFNQDDELYRWQHIDLVGTARLRGDSAQAASTVPGPCPIPRVFAATDLYWICMGWLMSIGTFFLLRCLCKKEGRLPRCSIKVVARRYRLPKTQHVRGHRWYSFLLPMLIVSQHFHGSTGLLLRTATLGNTEADLSDFTWPTEPFRSLPHPWALFLMCYLMIHGSDCHLLGIRLKIYRIWRPYLHLTDVSYFLSWNFVAAFYWLLLGSDLRLDLQVRPQLRPLNAMLPVLGVDRSPHLLDQAGFHQLCME